MTEDGFKPEGLPDGTDEEHKVTRSTLSLKITASGKYEKKLYVVEGDTLEQVRKMIDDSVANFRYMQSQDLEVQ